MGDRGGDGRLLRGVFRTLFRGERRERHRFPGLLGRQPVLDPQLHRDRAPKRPRGTHRAHHRDLGNHQRRLARAQAIRQQRRRAGGIPAFPAVGAGNLAALRRLRLPHHAAQRRLLVLPARPYIERADNTARILDVKYHMLLPEDQHVGGPLDYYQWAAILRTVSALTAYHWVYRESLKPWLIADLLILNQQMPRSLASCYENLVRFCDAIASAYGRQGLAQRHARSIRTRLQNSRMEEIFQTGLHEFIEEFVADNNALGAAVSSQYLV